MVPSINYGHFGQSTESKASILLKLFTDVSLWMWFDSYLIAQHFLLWKLWYGSPVQHTCFFKRKKKRRIAVITVITGFDTSEVNGLFSIALTHKPRVEAALSKRSFARRLKCSNKCSNATWHGEIHVNLTWKPMCCDRGFLYADDTFQVTFHSPFMINDGEYHSVKQMWITSVS